MHALSHFLDLNASNSCCALYLFALTTLKAATALIIVFSGKKKKVK